MLRISSIIAAIVVLSAGAASACNQADAKRRLESALQQRLILSTSMMNDRPTIHIERDLWSGLVLNTRAGLLATFDCAVAGPGKLLSEIYVVSETGRTLAVWDGRRKKLDVRE